MPHSTDDSNDSVLPHPELNPLLNPLLAAHMGRWAEVYFTNPPDRREQAVAELLRELESNPLPESVPVQPGSDQQNQSNDSRTNDEAREFHDEAAANTSPAHEPDLTCSSCGERNWRGQRFCGMCGAPLGLWPEAQTPQVAEALPIAERSWSEPRVSLEDRSDEYAVELKASAGAGGRYEAEDPAWLRPTALPGFAMEPEPAPRRYRVYIGVVLAILFGVLFYVGWRNTGSRSDAAALQSRPSPAMPSPEPAQAIPAQPSAPENALPANARPAAPRHQPQANSQKDQAADSRPAAPAVQRPASSSTTVPEQSGSEELAMAEKYLKGGPGKARDSGEAVRWLWKAIGKQNLAATMELSDLFLRGDGVPKNCDQARVLLQTAARRGGTAAAERLRNLQAFGCQ